MKKLPSCLGDFRQQKEWENSASRDAGTRFARKSKLRITNGTDNRALVLGGEDPYNIQPFPSGLLIGRWTDHLSKSPAFRVVHGFSPSDSQKGIGCLSSVKNLAISSPFNLQKGNTQPKHRGSQIGEEIGRAHV